MRSSRYTPAPRDRAGAGMAVADDADSATDMPQTHHTRSIDDVFFRHIVSGMRNGVLAITRDGRLALINEEAYRIFGVTPSPHDGGQLLSSVLREHPDVVRVLTGSFELHHLPNRVELRLKPSGKVIGYTLALVRD